MNQGLKEYLRGMLDRKLWDPCLQKGTRISEHGKTVSISAKEPNEAVVVWKVDQCKPGPACDALFLYARRSDTRIGVVLVELKGNKVGHAIEQLEATFTLLCEKIGREHPKIRDHRTHGQRVLGVVLASNNRYSLYQSKRKRLKQKGLLVLTRKSGQIDDLVKSSKKSDR